MTSGLDNTIGYHMLSNPDVTSLFPSQTLQCHLFVCLFVRLSVCPLPFFLATAEPIALKFGMVFRNGVGQTAKQFGAKWMQNGPKTGPKRGQNGAQNA